MEVLKVVLQFLVGKARDSIADRWKEGTANKEKLRQMIQRELKEIKDSLKDLARKDLLSSVTFTDNGLVAMKNYESTNDETSLSHAMDCFDKSIEWSTHAFENVSLSIQDRILATKIQITATLMKLQKNPQLAMELSVKCLHRLFELDAAKKAFKQKCGKKKMFANKLEADIRQEVCAIKRALFHYIFISKSILNLEWPLSTWHPPHNCTEVLARHMEPLDLITFASDQTLIVLSRFGLRMVRIIDIFRGDVVSEFKLTPGGRSFDYAIKFAYDPDKKLMYFLTTVSVVGAIEGLDVQVYDKYGEFINGVPLQEFCGYVVNACVDIDGNKVVVVCERNVWVLGQENLNIIKSKRFPDACSLTGCAIIGEEIYLSNPSSDKVLVLSMDLEDSRELALQDAKNRLVCPCDIAYDAVTGHIIIADRGKDRVHIFTKQGDHLQKIDMMPGWRPRHVLTSPEGRLLIRCFKDGRHDVLVMK